MATEIGNITLFDNHDNLVRMQGVTASNQTADIILTLTDERLCALDPITVNASICGGIATFNLHIDCSLESTNYKLSMGFYTYSIALASDPNTEIAKGLLDILLNEEIN